MALKIPNLVLLLALSTYLVTGSTADKATCPPGSCPPNQTCTLVEVQCIQAPCNPVPQCQNKTRAVRAPPGPCDTVRCRSGYTCTEIQPQCFTTPCPAATAECVPDNETCGTNICSEGTCCEMEEVKCYGYYCPSPSPQPTCVSCSNCDLVDCVSGFIWVNKVIKSCCKTEAVCIPPVAMMESDK